MKFKINKDYPECSLTWGKGKKKKDILLSYRNDWQQFDFWREAHWNWYTFTFFEFTIENDWRLGAWEFVLNILGLGITVRYCYNYYTPFWKELNSQTDEIFKKKKPGAKSSKKGLGKSRQT